MGGPQQFASYIIRAFVLIHEIDINRKATYIRWKGRLYVWKHVLFESSYSRAPLYLSSHKHNFIIN